MRGSGVFLCFTQSAAFKYIPILVTLSHTLAFSVRMQVKILWESSLPMPTISYRINKLQIVIGIIALLVGTLVYLIDRPPDHTYFVYSSSINMSLYNILPNVFGDTGNHLPEFIHAFSFILITAGLLSCRKRGCLIVCFCWFSIDTAFELGQKYSSLSAKIIPDWFGCIPFLENTRGYFIKGTFDIFDIVAIMLGTMMAYLILLLTMKRGETNEEE